MNIKHLKIENKKVAALKSSSFASFSDDKIEKLVKSKKGVKVYIANCYKKIAKLFNEINYEPENLEDANNMLKYHILDIKNPKQIFAKFVDENGKKQQLEITPQTFYRAYNKQVWKKLSLKERAQIVNWHFEYKKKQINYKDLNLRFIQNIENSVEYNAYGEYDFDFNLIYINPKYLFGNKFLELAQTMEHEFEHAKQQMLTFYLTKRNPKSMNIYELMRSVDFNTGYIDIKGIKKWQDDLFYSGDPMERACEIRSIKNLIKYFKENEKVGLFSEDDKYDFDTYKLDMWYFDNILKPSVVKNEFVISQEDLDKYKKECNFIKKMDYILKLSLLKYYYEYVDDKHTLDEVNKITEKIDEALSKYIKTNKKDKSLEQEAIETLCIKEK